MTDVPPPNAPPPDALPSDAPLSDAWGEADAALLAHLDAFDRSVRETVAALRDAAEAEAAEPLRRLVAEAAEAHRREMETHGFDRPLDAPPRPPVVLWDALTAYRSAMTEVYTRFRERLRDLDLGTAIGALYEQQTEALAAQAAEAPEAVIRSEPEGLTEPEAGDSLALLAGKLAERARRRTRAVGRSIVNGLRRLVGKAAFPEAAYAQAVPLRALLEEQALARVPHVLLADHEQVQTALGRCVAQLEGAFAAWAGNLLRLESGLDRPRFHTAEGLDWAEGQKAEDPGRGQRTPAADGEAVGAETGLAAEPAPVTAPEASTTAPDSPGAAPDRDEVRAKVRRVREAVQAFDAALHGALVAVPSVNTADLDAARDALAERVRRSGYDSDRRAAPGEGDPLGELRNAAARWGGWHRNVVRRLGVDGLLLNLRGQLVEEVDALVDRVAEAVVHPVRTTVRRAADALAELKAEAVAACDRHADPASLAVALRDLLRRATAHIEREMLPALQPVSLDRAVEEAVAATQERLREAVRPLPESVTLHARLGPERAGHPGAAAEVELRKIVGSTLSEEFAARLVRSADALRQPILTALAEAENVRDVVRFNLETAVEELEGTEGDAEDSIEDAESVETPDLLANARELTVDGLARAEERLSGVVAPLAEPWRAFVRYATETFEQSWTTLHERANAETLVAAGLLDLKARTSRTIERLRLKAGTFGGRARTFAERWLRFGRGKAKRLVEMGQQAAGLAEQSASDRRRTLDALAEAPTLHAGLPLVYRRLFSFNPLTDPTLFVGRTAELARLAEQAERWREGRDASAVVVTSDPGGGRSSFLNVLQATTFQDEAPARLAFTERAETDGEVAARIGEALGLGTPASFADLEATLLSDAFAERRRVCLIEGLEHLLLRAPGGLDLIERTLIFLSRTDTEVLWVCTAVRPGWEFVERTAPQITGLVDVVPLPLFTRDEIETALTKRHARSGLPFEFAVPVQPPALLARRLSKAETPEARQAVLRGEFFDALYRTGGSGFRLALLYWLRAADFQQDADEAVAGALTLRPIRPLDFAFVGTFDLSRSFALKALLQHGTLTLGEHDRVFRTPREESFLIFESLHNLRLIQRTDGPEASLSIRRNGTAPHAPRPVEEDARYRLHPLVVAPVTAALRAKNML